MAGFFHFLEVLVAWVFGLIGFVVLLFALLMALPNSALRDIVAAFAKRFAATAALTAIAVPAQQIPALGAVYDIAAMFILITFWMSIFETIGRALNFRPQSKEQRAPARIEPEFHGGELDAPDGRDRLSVSTRSGHE